MKLNRNLLSDAVRYGLVAGLATAVVAPAAFAQEAEDSEAKTLDRIEVTGSRLKRAEIEGASPVIVIDRAQIDASGDVSVADLLRDATFASGGNFKPQSGSSAQSLATIDLRGLGSGRTLVLLDGRRAPTNPMSASSGADVNAIPLAAVERIEILSDGASAVYGSDAIGGVVNIILRKDFNGAELRYGVGNTKVQGGDLEDASIVFGSSSDRSRLIGGGSKSKRGMVFTRDQIGGEGLGVSTYGNNWASPNGIAAVPGFDCPSTTTRNVEYPFWLQSNGRCSFDFNSAAANEASVDNTAVFTMGDYQINDSWSVYMGASNTMVETFGRYAPVPGVVRAAEGTVNDIIQGNGAPTTYYHRFAAAGNRDSYTEAKNMDFLLGFNGQLTDTVAVEFGARRTNYDYNELGYGYIIQSLAEQAINRGDYLLTNPYGASQETLDSFTATIGRDSFFKTREYFANISFDLFEMGGGISNAVVGAEYREESFQDVYDSLSRAGVVLGSSGGSSAGGRDVSSAYFEWLFPFHSTLEATLAGRFDSYSDYGSDFSPKLSLRYSPWDKLTFRGSYGQGFRAPGLDILTQADSFSADFVVDPATCLYNGLSRNCYLGQDQYSIQVDTWYIANPNLESEQSTQFSIGAIYSPFDWLDVSLDYSNIKIENSISQISAQGVVNRELYPELYGPIPDGLGLTRDCSLIPGGATGTACPVSEVIAGYRNTGTLNAENFDFRLNTDFDLGDAGRLQNQLTASYVGKYEIEYVALAIDQAGYMGLPQYRANLANIWSIGDFQVVFQTNFIKGQHNPPTITDDNEVIMGNRVGGYATNDLQLTWNAPWNGKVSIGATNIGNRYPELVDYDGRPWNFYLYDAYGRTTYLRYTQTF